MGDALETPEPSEKVMQSADTARCTIVPISGNDFLYTAATREPEISHVLRP